MKIMNTKLLFVCSCNKDRSPTAVDILADVKGFEAQCAGTHPAAPTKLSKTLTDWADYIFAMQNHHAEEVMKLSPGAKKKTHVLHVPDIFDQPELKTMLRDRLSHYFPHLSMQGNESRITS